MPTDKEKIKSVFLSVLLATTVLVNALFIMFFLFFMGFFVGKVDCNKQFIEGVQIGQEKGRYEVYLELEKRSIGYYRSTDDTFVFYEKNKE